jgi:hypothetical protein
MDTTFCAEQVEALAESVNGEDTSLPLMGLLTVTPANTGAVSAERNNRENQEVFIKRP